MHADTFYGPPIHVRRERVGQNLCYLKWVVALHSIALLIPRSDRSNHDYRKEDDFEVLEIVADPVSEDLKPPETAGAHEDPVTPGNSDAPENPETVIAPRPYINVMLDSGELRCTSSAFSDPSYKYIMVQVLRAPSYHNT